MNPNLNPKDLRTKVAKQLLQASYQLENLTHKVEFNRIISYKTSEQIEGGIITSKRQKFIEDLRQDVIEYTPKVNRKLKFSRKKAFEKISRISRKINRENNRSNKKGEER